MPGCLSTVVRTQERGSLSAVSSVSQPRPFARPLSPRSLTTTHTAPRYPRAPALPCLQKKDVGSRKEMLARRSAIQKRSTAKPATVGEKLAARAKKFVALRKAEKAKAQPSACECAAQAYPQVQKRNVGKQP